ncbi:predicted protein [Botrytis cinerea T4]|uniref:Uncharacterized protein n=1 Tax=Botryotinia fuckeliana (strain T4) TaxID=999810 RepID=G2XYC3_BOTF4|nr:predicted protein [Botrytis cinerea T4]
MMCNSLIFYGSKQNSSISFSGHISDLEGLCSEEI